MDNWRAVNPWGRWCSYLALGSMLLASLPLALDGELWPAVVLTGYAIVCGALIALLIGIRRPGDEFF